MSITEILEELPKLRLEERDVIRRRLEELALDDISNTELLAAIDIADASPRENDVSGEEMLKRMTKWTSIR